MSIAEITRIKNTLRHNQWNKFIESSFTKDNVNLSQIVKPFGISYADAFFHVKKY